MRCLSDAESRSFLATSKSYTIICTVSPASEGDGWTCGKISTPIVQEAFTTTSFSLELSLTLAQVLQEKELGVGGEATIHKASVDNLFFSGVKWIFQQIFWQY